MSDYEKQLEEQNEDLKQKLSRSEVEIANFKESMDKFAPFWVSRPEGRTPGKSTVVRPVLFRNLFTEIASIHYDTKGIWTVTSHCLVPFHSFGGISKDEAMQYVEKYYKDYVERTTHERL